LSDGFEAQGAVDFNGAKVGGQFNCTGGKFKDKSEWCLFAQRITVERHVFLSDGFEAEGAVNFNGAKVAGQFNCTGGKFKDKSEWCLFAQRITVEQDVFLRNGFEAEGAVNFVGAKVGGLFVITGNSNSALKSLDLRYAHIVGSLRVSDLPDTLNKIDLRDAYVNEWDDRWAVNVNSYRWSQLQQRLFEWGFKRVKPPDQRSAKYLLSGFTYDAIGEHLGEVAHKNPAAIAHWLYHADGCKYDPQPYDQMAKVLESHGYEDAFREVIIAIRIERRRKGNLSAWLSFFDWLLLDVPVRYGYRPWRAIAWGGLICAFAALLFGLGYPAGGLAPADGDVLVEVNRAKEMYVKSLPPEVAEQAKQRPLSQFLPEGYAKFSPVMYAVDLFLPIIDLGQERFWVPDAAHELGLWLWVLKWFVILSGWYLTTLFISSFTGLLRVR
jgi:hypothetical protein